MAVSKATLPKATVELVGKVRVMQLSSFCSHEVCHLRNASRD